MKRLTPFEFIEKARLVHGDKYDYSKIKHVYSSDKVTIICKEQGHGEFEQSPNHHLKGHGCSICGKIKKAASKTLTLAKFIEIAKQKHENKYNYDKVVYLGNKKKVTITCPENGHGNFEQTPGNHINLKQGCPTCGGTGKLDKEKFIERAKQKHGYRYNYDKVEYKNSSTRVIISCSMHGDFEQTPNSHLKGNGCRECSGTGKLSKEEFIEKAKQKHGDKFNYDKVNYIDYNKKVTIICNEHDGEFDQIPSSHLSGKGCPECGGTKKLSTGKFIEKAKQKHGDKFNYDKANYIDYNKKVTIICNEHDGEFEQTPKSHLKGNGCLKCGKAKTASKNTLTQEEFIERAKQKHGVRYTYDKINYINNNTKVIITCLFHGDFNQTPSNHLSGKGCRKCKIPKGENRVEDVLKNKQIEYKNEYSFEDCRDKGLLRFDFAIWINNKIGLIEYQGEQHYKQIGFSKTNTHLPLETNKKRDKIKEEYAKTKKIPLLLISYTEFDKVKSLIEKFVAENFSL